MKYLLIPVLALLGACAALWCAGCYCLGKYGGSDDDDETCGLLEED